MPFIHLGKGFFSALCVSQNILPASQYSTVGKQRKVGVSLLRQDPVTWANKREATELRRLGSCQIAGKYTEVLPKVTIFPTTGSVACTGVRGGDVFVVAIARKLP